MRKFILPLLLTALMPTMAFAQGENNDTISLGPNHLYVQDSASGVLSVSGGVDPNKGGMTIRVTIYRGFDDFYLWVNPVTGQALMLPYTRWEILNQYIAQVLDSSHPGQAGHFPPYQFPTSVTECMLLLVEYHEDWQVPPDTEPDWHLIETFGPNWICPETNWIGVPNSPFKE